ncbi:DUF262 domain-containing protein [Chryseobacterium sp. SIMBA_029]|uniref:DUF262 domain-containing protein n=1 Tax=Chryseobacterium sp. SIMBA_029 TaxID=3085772 RepID=UPI0039796B0B
MQFDHKLKEYFSAEKGAYSEVTPREFYDSQITLTGVEADIVESYFGKNNINVGSVKSNVELSSKRFLILPDLMEVELNLVYPKASKSELRLYLRKGFKPNGGDIFVVYISKDNKLVIGGYPIEEWRGISEDYEQLSLFEDENVIDDVESNDNEDDSESEYMSQPFDPTKIDVDTKTPSLDTLIKRIYRGNIQMDTSKYFQRRADLWDNKKQSRLIESILIRFPLPAFYFDATDDENWLIVDGLQRLSSIRNFCVDKTLVLDKLEFLTQLNGKSWDDLGGDMQRLIEETQVVIYKIMPGTPTDVKFNIFKRINTGGISLSPQEIRHALFQGKPAEFVQDLANCSEFIDATFGTISTKRMADRDFINRFLAFYLLGYKNYQPDLDTYMSKAMASLYDKTNDEIEKIGNDFKRAMFLSSEIFDKEAFRRPNFSTQRLSPLNKALFDVLSSQFALLNFEESEALLNNKRLFRDKFYSLFEHDDYFNLTITSSTGNQKRINYRHSQIEEIINDILNK